MVKFKFKIEKVLPSGKVDKHEVTIKAKDKMSACAIIRNMFPGYEIIS